MRTLEVSLIEWPEGPERGGPRLLGRTEDPEVVAAVSERLAAEGRKALARFKGPPVRLVGAPDADAPRRPPRD